MPDASAEARPASYVSALTTPTAFDERLSDDHDLLGSLETLTPTRDSHSQRPSETPLFQQESLAVVSAWDISQEQPQSQSYSEHGGYVGSVPTIDAALENRSNRILEACLLRYFVEELAHWVSNSVPLQYRG